MTYNVVLQALVNVRVEGVEATSQQEAIEAAIDSVDFRQLAPSGFCVPANAVWAELADEMPANALVDDVGDDEHDKSAWYCLDPVAGWRPID